MTFDWASNWPAGKLLLSKSKDGQSARAAEQ